MIRAAALALALLTGIAAAEPPAHPLRVAQPGAAPAEALLAVEIPAGGQVKYEFGADGLLRVDRFLSMAVAYPANYGALPSTLGGDGDPLDALVLTRAPLQPGALVRFRPLGVLRMSDGGEADEKLIGVPADDVDPTYAGVRALDDLPAMELRRIEAFFRVYKDLPGDGGRIVLSGYGDAAEAQAVLRAAMARYRDAAR
ncbi:inorganic diphosphatase [Luteimonas huabeiensis]|uniref:inorganic diphosphatase n=1 Tax=Luteimonas huabeiensis TaxID=1244513 RepID=UPI0004662402|nr:inorganic diphosphatase [Luteimonas huabeiensis]